MRLPADLAAAPVELGWASRPDLEVNGGVALSAVIGRRIVTVAAVQDGIGSVRYPAGADAEMTRRAALALAGARDDGGAVGRRRP